MSSLRFEKNGLEGGSPRKRRGTRGGGSFPADPFLPGRSAFLLTLPEIFKCGNQFQVNHRAEY